MDTEATNVKPGDDKHQPSYSPTETITPGKRTRNATTDHKEAQPNKKAKLKDCTGSATKPDTASCLIDNKEWTCACCFDDFSDGVLAFDKQKNTDYESLPIASKIMYSCESCGIKTCWVCATKSLAMSPYDCEVIGARCFVCRQISTGYLPSMDVVKEGWNSSGGLTEVHDARGNPFFTGPSAVECKIDRMEEDEFDPESSHSGFDSDFDSLEEEDVQETLPEPLASNSTDEKEEVVVLLQRTLKLLQILREFRSPDIDVDECDEDKLEKGTEIAEIECMLCCALAGPVMIGRLSLEDKSYVSELALAINNVTHKREDGRVNIFDTLSVINRVANSFFPMKRSDYKFGKLFHELLVDTMRFRIGAVDTKHVGQLTFAASFVLPVFSGLGSPACLPDNPATSLSEANTHKTNNRRKPRTPAVRASESEKLPVNRSLF